MKRRAATRNLDGGDPLLSSRNSWTRTRKRPKYLSLRSQLSPQNKAAVADKDVPRTNGHRLLPLRHYYTRRRGDQQRLKQTLPHVQRPLLPLGNCLAIDDHVALLFTSSDEASATLKGILDCGKEETCTASAAGTSGEESVSLRFAYGGSGPELRSAMKSGYSGQDGGKDHEEKWVRFSEVVEKMDEEVSSNYCTPGPAVRGLLSLSLKLDYQEILDAWSDKGSLFFGMDESPQTVPDLFPKSDAFGNGVMDWFRSGANLWTVPEIGSADWGDNKEERMRKREVSMLRYKEKRHNRLFANRIRYEVRKLNAEKRPRVKGRFVRRNGEELSR